MIIWFGYYLLNHRSKKWWRRILFYLMEVLAYNVYIIARDTNPDQANSMWPTFQSFLEDLVIALIGNIRGGKVTRTEHNIDRIFEKNKTCGECSLAAQPGERRCVTKFGCRECNVPVHMECQAKHIMRCIK